MGRNIETAKYHKVDVWGWRCPQCGRFNESGVDPAILDFLFCGDCNKYFKPVEAE